MRQFYLLLFLMIGAGTGIAQPQITFKQTTYELGEVEFGAWTGVSFYFTNTGNRPLRILDVACDGGCMEHHYPTDSILPGKSSYLEVKCNATVEGKFLHTLTIKTNASLQPVELKITGEVLPADSRVKFDQTLVDLGEIKYGEEKTAFIKFHLGKRTDNVTCNTFGSDTIRCYMAPMREDFLNGPRSTYYSKWGGKPDSGYLQIIVKNEEGNSGDFEKPLTFNVGYNGKISPVTVKGKFVDKEKRRVDITKFGKEGHLDRYFSNGHPDSIRFFNYYGKLYQVRYFEKGLAYHDKIYFKPGPVMLFRSLVHDYGRIEKGSNGSCEFWFRNGGDEPLVICNAQSSCGCVVPSFPKEPIKPGDSACIKVKYDTQRIGNFEKTVTVTSNAEPASVVLKIRGRVFSVFTEMKLERDTIDLGRIAFGNSKEVQVRFYNTGPGKLWVDDYYSHMDEILNCRCSMDFSADYFSATPGADFRLDNGTVSLIVHNYAGNTGRYTCKLKLESNTTTEHYIIVKCEMTGGEVKDTLMIPGEYSGQKKRLHYTGGKLDTVLVYNWKCELGEKKVYTWGKDGEVRIGRYFGNKLSSERVYVGGELKEEKYY